MDTATVSPPTPDGTARWERISAAPRPAAPRRSAWIRYGAAVVLVLAMTGLTAVLQTRFNPGIFPLYFLAVALAAWFGGVGPGLTASLLSVVLANAVVLGHGPLAWRAEDLPRLAVFLAVAVVVANVSASQRRTETALRASEARLRAMMDTASEGIWLVDPAGRTLYANDRMADLLGVDAAALDRRDIAAAVPPADLPAWSSRLATVAAGGRDTFEARLLRADGREVAVSVGLSPVPGAGGAAAGALGMFTDITERVDAERALAADLDRRSALAAENARLVREARAAEARYRGLFAGVRDAIVVIDEAGTVVEANAAAAELAALPAERLPGRPFAGLLASGAEWRERILPALREEGVWRGEADVRAADGEVTPVDLSIAEVALPDGRSAVAVLRDVRERREMELMQEEFLASVAHDLKNPLAAVRGQAQLLRRRAQKGEPIEQERLLAGLAGIDEGAGRMARMIDDLVDVARLRGGQTLELRRQPVDLVALVGRMVEEAQRSGDRRAVRFAADEESLVGMWDGTRIERVLANLIGNALKYSPGGGDVTVTVSRDSGWGEPCAAIAVTDRGVGIPAADLPYVFERFRRGRNVGGIRGSGIGLAGARSIVEGHGGTITVESVEGEGSTFTVRLPLDGA